MGKPDQPIKRDFGYEGEGKKNERMKDESEKKERKNF